jgi:hypothetical protein
MENKIKRKVLAIRLGFHPLGVIFLDGKKQRGKEGEAVAGIADPLVSPECRGLGLRGGDGPRVAIGIQYPILASYCSL